MTRKRIFFVDVKLFKPSGKWYSTERRRFIATDCGSEVVPGDPPALSPPNCYIHDVTDQIKADFLAERPIADGAKGDVGWFVVIDDDDVVPALIRLGSR